ncbi:hypothetical protein TDE_0573 [Treponema denticola ATCC 35405]|uniref:Uncharacterized protein n=1 Tax=Treponema denticola (strain ATCC 35405 / DSM 14222 / CIP 103919 / JCM 8153 / KCTC 15104) TaxID=243275 RepID=Q73Q70_TREDE|nr:hypothetical protein TDE_0573 [Treponema denticola ATCC 35405]
MGNFPITNYKLKNRLECGESSGSGRFFIRRGHADTCLRAGTLRKTCRLP